MAKKFGGFTPEQKEILARKMGFTGPMAGFGQFLQSSPANSSRFLQYENKAKQMVEGTALQKPKPLPAFAAGGTTTITDVATIQENAQNSEGSQTTADMIANPEAYSTPTEVVTASVTPDTVVDTNSGQVASTPDVKASTATASQAADIEATEAAKYKASTVTDEVKDATQKMKAAQGTVSTQAQAVAATAQPSANATVQGQLEKLMKGFEGGQTPAWAAGAMRNVNALMASRGMGSSSMAASATTQAAMESAIGVAVQDAATYSSFEMQNLNNRQQAALQNAQAFLQMDLANLDNRQQTAMFKGQSIIQSLFSDQAAQNAAKQFNASSENQTNQFFASLKSSTDQFNIAQKNSMSQFNTDQVNSVSMFNKQMNAARDQFNATNRLVVDQANATWRQQVTLANTQAQNEANRLDAQSLSAMTMAAYNNMMQQERDFYSFAFQASENAQERASQLFMAKLAADTEMDAATGNALGNLAGAIFSTPW